MKKLSDKTIVIVGPTASGKSDLAILLAHTYDGEIISADSRQVYRGMDIGTGKVIRDEIMNHELVEEYFSEGIIHHLIDIANPKRTYNVTHFIRDTKKAVADIRKHGKTPIICGGTGFWVQAFIDDRVFPTVKPDAKFRKRLEKLSTEKIFSMLEKRDPRRARTIDAKNKVRLIRALEICRTLGSVPLPHQTSPVNYQDLYIIAISPDKETIHKNIDIRLEKRLKQGMIAEIEKLHEDGLGWKRLESFGLEYKYIALFLQKKITGAEMKKRLNFEIRHYAKRQITWLRRWEKMGATIHWITKPSEAMRIIKKI